MSYYCYVYYDEDWSAYYVGKGRGKRLYKPEKHPSLPPRKRMQVFRFCHEWQAYECEIELIAFFGRKSDGGTLDNISTGGPGSPGYTRPFAKVWEITYPCGKVEIKKGLYEFCRQTGINQGRLSEIAQGKRKSYRGYKVRLLN